MIDYERLLKVLFEQGVEFIIVGGVAATIHGSARLTQDLDIVYQRTPENIERLVHALESCKPYLKNVRAINRDHSPLPAPLCRKGVAGNF